MTSQNLPSWYEASLPPQERKVRGHFSTPPHLVEQILDACCYTSDRDLAPLRVLDPACGSGNFLLGTTRRLIASIKQSNLDNKQLTKFVQRNVWGFDPDPVACFLAEMQIRNTLALEQGYRKNAARLHIHQADGLAFPWTQKGQVDLFLANPPYLAAKNTDLSAYRSPQQSGQSDSYLLFLNLALQIVRPNGWIGLVLPDPVLARTNARKERQHLLAETTIHHLWHLSNVFTAYVGAVVIIAQKCPPRHIHQIHWKRERWQRHPTTTANTAPKEQVSAHQIHENNMKSVAQESLRHQPGAELRYLLSAVQGTLIEHLHTHLHKSSMYNEQRSLAKLDDFIMVHRGEEIGKDNSFLLNKLATYSHVEHVEYYPVLRGGVDIRPYGIPDAQYWIERSAIGKSLKRYLAPKLLVIKSTGRLQATLDLRGHVVLQTLYMLQLRDQRPPLWQTNEQYSGHGEDDLYFLLALLNSRLLQDYVYILHTAYKWVQPQIEQHVLAHLPVPTLATMHERAQIVQRARLLEHACSELSSVVELKEHNKELYEEQEHAICALYSLALQQRQATLSSEQSIQSI